MNLKENDFVVIFATMEIGIIRNCSNRGYRVSDFLGFKNDGFFKKSEITPLRIEDIDKWVDKLQVLKKVMTEVTEGLNEDAKK